MIASQELPRHQFREGEGAGALPAELGRAHADCSAARPSRRTASSLPRFRPVRESRRTVGAGVGSIGPGRWGRAREAHSRAVVFTAPPGQTDAVRGRPPKPRPLRCPAVASAGAEGHLRTHPPQAGGGGMEPLARAGSAWGRWPLTGPRLTLSIYLPQSLNFRGRERTPGAMTIVLSRGPGWRGLCPTSPWSTRLSIRTDPQVPVCCGSGPPPSPLSGHSSSRLLGGCGQRPARVWRRITVFTTRRNPGARGPMRKGTGRPQVPFSF